MKHVFPTLDDEYELTCPSWLRAKLCSFLGSRDAQFTCIEQAHAMVKVLERKARKRPRSLERFLEDRDTERGDERSGVERAKCTMGYTRFCDSGGPHQDASTKAQDDGETRSS
jgi:hypothetical protein